VLVSCLLSQWAAHHLWILDKTIRIWNAETGSAVSKPLEGHTRPPASVAYSLDGEHIMSKSTDGVNYLSDSFSHDPIRCPSLAMNPDPEGWVRDSKGGLLYWVPQDCRKGLHSPALFTILSHLLFGQFRFNLRSLPLEPLGPKFTTLYSLSLDTVLVLCCID
jgi:WD40 repeat protein